jgi:hypothetical protein
MSKWVTASGAFYSPDGTTLVFARRRGPRAHLHVDPILPDAKYPNFEEVFLAPHAQGRQVGRLEREDTFDMQQSKEPATLLRIGTMIAVVGGLLQAVIWLIIIAQPRGSMENLWTYALIPPLFLSGLALLAGVAVVVLHFVVKLFSK